MAWHGQGDGEKAKEAERTISVLDPGRGEAGQASHARFEAVRRVSLEAANEVVQIAR
jgi:hypothetical protein